MAGEEGANGERRDVHLVSEVDDHIDAEDHGHGEHKQVHDAHDEPRLGRLFSIRRLEAADVHQDQPEDSDRHVTAVRAGERVEGGAEQTARQRQTPVVDEVLELVDLAREEDQAEEDRPEKVVPRAAQIALLDRIHRQRHQQR